MNLCREHGEPSRDQRQGARDGACERCRPPQRKRPHSMPRKDVVEQREWWEYLI